MTAQHHDVQSKIPADPNCPTPESTDPLGPITLPKRSKVGARAMALAGTVGLSAFAAAAAVVTPDSIPWTTI
jgi:acetyltransferase-like isoleucine patch superfamily enzyme